MKRPVGLLVLLLALAVPAAAAAGELISISTAAAPVIDGRAADPAWKSAPVFVTHDRVADVDIELRSLHTGSEIFILARYPDPDESRAHKLWHWDQAKGMYVQGPEREDALVIKWAMSPQTRDLTLGATIPYEADIWYWKACRTDPVGHADDKIQRLTRVPARKAKQLIAADGRTMYLTRSGDQGRGAYKTLLYTEHEKDVMPRFATRAPEGSRADIRAKGTWHDGAWTIEFARRLVTGHQDDVNFRSLKQGYLFGVSRYEIAGRGPDPAAAVPLFGSGEISEPLHLVFK